MIKFTINAILEAVNAFIQHYVPFNICKSHLYTHVKVVLCNAKVDFWRLNRAICQL